MTRAITKVPAMTPGMRERIANASPIIDAMLADSDVVETDAAGEPCVIDRAAALLPPALQSKAHAGVSAPRTANRVWHENPICVECGKRIQSPENCGLVTLADGTHRLAHRTRCFVRALLSANPTITTGDHVPARTH